jgi:rhamnose transport system permease protein
MTMTPTASGRTAARQPSILPTLLLRWETLLMVLLLLGAAGNAYLSENFLDVTNLFNMTVDFMETSIIALPMALIIVSGNIDLSVASTLALSAIVMGVLFQAGWNVWLASLAGLAVGALAGLANGLLVTRVRLPSLVVTLGTYALYRGLASAIVGDEALSGFPDDFTTIGQGYLPGCRCRWRSSWCWWCRSRCCCTAPASAGWCTPSGATRRPAASPGWRWTASKSSCSCSPG